MLSRLRITLWVCLLFSWLLSSWLAGRALLFPFGLDYGEAPLADQAARLIAGQTLYRTDLDTAPYVITNYGPLFPAAMALTHQLTGLPMLTAGRAISLIAALVCALLIGLFAYKLTGDRLAAALAATLFFGHPMVIFWSTLARVDLLALCLGLSALYTLYRRPRSWRWLGVAVALMLAAIYTRQTAIIAVPLAGAIWLWHFSPRRSLVFLATLAGASLAIFGIAVLMTRSGFYLHTVIANVNHYDYLHLAWMGRRLLRVSLFGIIVAGIAAWQILAARQRPAVTAQQAAVQPFLRYGWPSYTVGAFISALTVGKVGSNVNYFLEILVALALWAGIALMWQKRTWLTIGLISLLLVQLIWGVIGAVTSYNTDLGARWRHLDESQALYAEVTAAAATGPVLADDFMDMVMLSGHRLYLQPFEYTQLARAGLWDPAALVMAVEQRQFPLIITTTPGTPLNRDRWSAPVMAAIEGHYTVERRFRDYTVYRPATGLSEDHGESN